MCLSRTLFSSVLTARWPDSGCHILGECTVKGTIFQGCTAQCCTVLCPVLWGADLTGNRGNFSKGISGYWQIWGLLLHCGLFSVSASSVEEEIQLPTEFSEGLCWFSVLKWVTETPLEVEGVAGVSVRIQGWRSMSSSNIRWAGSILRHWAIKSWHSEIKSKFQSKDERSPVYFLPLDAPICYV